MYMLSASFDKKTKQENALQQISDVDNAKPRQL
jgi:hypothetical protein